MTLILNGTDNSATTPAVTGTDTDTGVYYPAANQVALATNGTLALLVDASRNIGLGVTPSVSTLNGLIEGSYGNIGFTSGLGVSIAGNAYYDSNWKYKLASTATLQSQDSQGFKWFTAPTGTVGNAITFTQSLGLVHGSTLTLAGGTSSAGTGIAFPATQSASSDANTLDDYEEGTWTPTVNGVNLGAVGRYTKVGRLVSISFSNQSGITGIAVNASMTCSGIPFNVVGGLWENAAAALMVWNNQSTSYPDELACGRLANSSQISMTNKGSEATTTLDPWGLSVVYFTS